MTAIHPGTGKASIIILTYNNIELTRLCLDSILEHTTYPDYEIIVVDNASRDGTPAYLKGMAEEHGNLRLVFNETNEGFARGNNQGVAVATGDFIVFLNNDTVVTLGWLAGLIRYLDDPQVGMVGPLTNSSGNESQVAVDYETLEEMHEFAREYTREHQGESFAISMLPFQCVALRRQVFEEIGPLDEIFGQGMFEDDDYALRLKQRGYRILCAEDVFIHHWGSASFSKIGANNYWQLFKRNLKRFEEKWSIEWLPHTQRRELISQQYRTVLDNAIFFSDQIVMMERQIKASNQELSNIYQSNSWRFVQLIQRLRRYLLPHRSRREGIFLRLTKWTLQNASSLKTGLLERLQSKPKIQTARGKDTKNKNGEKLRTANMDHLARLSDGIEFRFPWPLVTILMPIYNHADLLRQAADSVLFSTYPNIELIILDDGSTDDIEPVLERLRHNPRVRIYRQPNQMLPRALTHAHEYARGEFITWTSADNLLIPETLQSLVSELIIHPEAVMVYADVGLIDDLGNPLRDRSYRPHNLDTDSPDILRLHRDAKPLAYEADNYINACFLYRREAAKALGGYYADDLLGLEDYDFWLRIQKAGTLRHIKNKKPLYQYRVHKRSMSHDILTSESALSAHIERTNLLMEYENQRREYSHRRWHLLLANNLTPAQISEISACANSLAVDISPLTKSPTPEKKYLRIVTDQDLVHDVVYARTLPYNWRLEWISTQDEHKNSIDVWKGIDIHPLALKARQYQANRSRYSTTTEQAVVGLHTSLRSLPLNLSSARTLIENNPTTLFTIVDTPGHDDPILGAKIVAGLDNAEYIGPKPLGEDYRLYATWDAVWLPPLQFDGISQSYRELLALAYSIARPFLTPKNIDLLPTPYQYCYYSPQESLEFLRELDRTDIDHTVLDRYLESWSRTGSFQRLLNYADAATQEIFTTRPNFNIEPPPKSKPIHWSPIQINQDKKIKCGLVVNTLDKGGLENVVAQMAMGLSNHGIETFIICTKEGGLTADSLSKHGVRIYQIQENEYLVREVLMEEKPHLVSTHLASKTFLETAYDLGIPILETIHNSYVWFDKEIWEHERARSRYYSHAIAVSQNTANYYLKWNHTFSSEWITEIPNGIDVERIKVIDKNIARGKININNDDFIFLSLASYSPVKNQIGIISAFHSVSTQYPEARLICMGNIADDTYFQQVSNYRETLRNKNRIELRQYTTDISLLLSAADAFVLDSIFEGWSLAATEALLAGIPIIHSDCGSGKELVGDQGERGIIIPNPIKPPINLTSEDVYILRSQKIQANRQFLIDAMEGMIINRDVWCRKSDEIRTYALENFVLDKMLGAYAKIIRRFAKL